MSKGKRKRISPKIRFWNMVDKSQGDNACWLWRGHRLPLVRVRNGKKSPNGDYGLFDIYIQDYPIKSKTVRAHRLVWEWRFGPIPEGKHVLHSCDTPSCVQPKYLFLGDNLVNVWDCWNKGRNVFQVNGNPATKLTDDDGRQIRKRRANGEKLQSIANSFGIAASIVTRIANGTRRGNVK